MHAVYIVALLEPGKPTLGYTTYGILLLLLFNTVDVRLEITNSLTEEFFTIIINNYSVSRYVIKRT